MSTPRIITWLVYSTICQYSLTFHRWNLYRFHRVFFFDQLWFPSHSPNTISMVHSVDYKFRPYSIFYFYSFLWFSESHNQSSNSAKFQTLLIHGKSSFCTEMKQNKAADWMHVCVFGLKETDVSLSISLLLSVVIHIDSSKLIPLLINPNWIPEDTHLSLLRKTIKNDSNIMETKQQIRKINTSKFNFAKLNFRLS